MRGVLLYGRRGGAVESLTVPKSVSVPNPCFIRSSLLNEMSNNSASSSNLVLAQKAVKQLRLEASVRRIKVSQAALELKTFCLQNAHKDPLLVGVPSSDNPFRPPKSCALF